MKKGAVFSEDRKYRYVLYRIWDYTLPRLMCIGLNPSTAEEDRNDPTINHLVSIATKLGFGGFYMTNLFALVSPNPEDLRRCPDPVKENDEYLKFAFEQSEVVVFCWGNFKQAEYRAKVMKQLFPSAKCFGKNKNKSPMHPLALMYNGTVNNPSLINF